MNILEYHLVLQGGVSLLAGSYGRKGLIRGWHPLARQIPE